MTNHNDVKLKIAIIGETGCGKSTLVNALLGKIVLPESPMTSTPILTYIEYLSQGNDYAEIIDADQNIIEKLGIEAFIKKYCFNVEEQRNVDRKRFSNISHAALHINADFLRNGVQIIDTLGFSASSHDTKTTESLLSNNLNLIFYVLSKNMLGDFEIERIQNLLGFRTDEQIKNGHEVIRRKTSLSKLYFICNEKEGIIEGGLQNSICRIFCSKDCNRSAAQIDNFAKEHILRCNFLLGRTLSCGIYPYSKYFSISPTKEETEFAVDMERRQKRYLKFSDEDKEYIMWKRMKKNINRIIDKKKKDVAEGRSNIAVIRFRTKESQTKLSQMRQQPSQVTDEFRKLLDEAKRGITNSQVMVGLAYDEGNEEMNVQVDYQEAFNWYFKAATANNAIAQYCLATFYEKGKYVQQDYMKAFAWYERSAKQGCTLAQVCLGLLYENGEGVEKNYFNAYNWYKKAAEKNDNNAQFFLGTMYATGTGLEQNYKIAFQWYKKAADAGNMYAMYCLGVMYENGDGVSRDYTESFNWYKKSAMLGHNEALKKIKKWK